MRIGHSSLRTRHVYSTMDKYATLGTLYELKNSRRKKRAELKLLKTPWTENIHSSSSPNIPLAAGRSLGKNGRRSHSISACVSEVTKCSLHILCTGTELDIRERYVKKEESWSENLASALSKKEKHSRDCEETCLTGEFIKKEEVKCAKTVSPHSVLPPPKPPELKGRFNVKFFNRVSKAKSFEKDNKTRSHIFQKLKSSETLPKLSPPSLENRLKPPKHPRMKHNWSTFISGKTQPKDDENNVVSRVETKDVRNWTKRSSSTLPTSIIYCAKVHLRSFTHILHRTEKRCEDVTDEDRHRVSSINNLLCMLSIVRR